MKTADYAAADADPFLGFVRRWAKNPRPANPSSTIPQVDGSGTAENEPAIAENGPGTVYVSCAL